MLLPQFFDNPFQIRLSFHKVIEQLEETARDSEGAKKLLDQVNAHPELRDGITDISQIKENELLISRLLTPLFPPLLSYNEIKGVSIPYQGLIFNQTERFRNILKAAGMSFDMNIRDFNDHQFYVGSCCMILNQFYGTELDFSKPLFYDIPTADGIVKHYRILYNADFIEVVPTEKAIKLTDADIKLLIDNYDDLALWKQKFPAGSWILKGFALVSLFDATTENAVAILKTSLLSDKAEPEMQNIIDSAFRSIFRIPDLRIGFTAFDKAEGKFSTRVFGKEIRSFLLTDKDEGECHEILSKASYQSLINEHEYYAVSDVAEYSANDPSNLRAARLKDQDIGSFILAPFIKDGVLLGILELVSSKVNVLNSVNAHRLEIVMPFFVETIDHRIKEHQNKVDAVIQKNYTNMHPSVNWKFRREAKNYIYNLNLGLAYNLKEIAFKDVYPLYGEVDIKNSSVTRNLSVKNDLKNQLNGLIVLLEQLELGGAVKGSEQYLPDLQRLLNELSLGIKADTEQNVLHYLEINIYPLFSKVQGSFKEDIEAYFKHANPLTGDFYANRRNYEKTLSLVNEKLITILDERQAEIQKHFPHYFERFKTDGVEHNVYIGASIAPEKKFDVADLERLRLWQLLVTAEMEIEQHRLKHILPYHLGVTSLILVFSAPIAIRFRMDEKHFDVDGAYNIRYEVIKKRIDKAYIKGTRERITSEGTITIVYSKAEEQAEYGRYIRILRSAGILTYKVEHLDVEDLQAVSGLKALRVGVAYETSRFLSQDFSYDGLYQELLDPKKSRVAV
ncbi:GAF domain-containing protein [Mucilaginibacter sp. BT774]|uniref:GAF domain-containing protein n=1 Tax=Mucilaginibacter sp. BT774 TaxID=3062276 RepID=UPI002675B917|nr:GAF domain-containing protein [Mucilaginibacter sp. BT774]MDO3628334.1 GAF domain-containing protein [Mucilaginibacter sp. BT774]